MPAAIASFVCTLLAVLMALSGSHVPELRELMWFFFLSAPVLGLFGLIWAGLARSWTRRALLVGLSLPSFGLVAFVIWVLIGLGPYMD